MPHVPRRSTAYATPYSSMKSKIRPAYDGIETDAVLVCAEHADEAAANDEALPWWYKNSPNPVVFHTAEPLSDDGRRETVMLPMLFHPLVNGLEDTTDLKLAAGATIAARYRVVERLGAGSFGETYSCAIVDRGDASTVCVKVAHQEANALLATIDEVRALRQVRAADPLGAHPLQRLVDYFFYREHILVVTTFAGTSLNHIFRGWSHGKRLAFFIKDGGLSALALQMADALALLHRLGITHADVKPHNVCMANGPSYTLIDFGSVVYEYATRNSCTQTLQYRAPEVMLGAQWNVAVDIWSLGCVLVEALLGAPLFPAATVERMLAMHVAVLGPLPPSLFGGAREAVRVGATPKQVMYEVDERVGLVRLAPQPTVLARVLPSAAASRPKLLSLLEGMLALDPTKRLTAEKARWHSFLNGCEPSPPRAAPYEPGFVPVANVDV